MSIGTETGQRRRSRVRLTPVRPVPVEFSGRRAREGPLTLGQLDVCAWQSGSPDQLYAILCAELPVPAVVSVEDVAEATGVLIARYESLRTTYVSGEQPRQRVAAAGVQLMEVCSLGEGQWGPRDRPAVAEALVRWLRESSDPGRRPVRVAVAIAPGAGGRVIACAAAFTHMAVDHGAIEILKRDFAGLLGDPVRRQAGRDRHQPLDQAELEATPAERARGEAALAYLREQSRRIPHCLYALPGARPAGESLAVELSSVAAAMAVRQVAARTRASRSSVVLAAICAVVARIVLFRACPADQVSTVAENTILNAGNSAFGGLVADPLDQANHACSPSFSAVAGHGRLVQGLQHRQRSIVHEQHLHRKRHRGADGERDAERNSDGQHPYLDLRAVHQVVP
ncbi:MAG TPA: hypothetical protein VFB06_32635 [Streptosporangiaceae bacterium]|nr:hypothetical protein [Streptosporangiaceae bacterium]